VGQIVTRANTADRHGRARSTSRRLGVHVSLTGNSGVPTYRDRAFLSSVPPIPRFGRFSSHLRHHGRSSFERERSACCSLVQTFVRLSVGSRASRETIARTGLSQRPNGRWHVRGVPSDASRRRRVLMAIVVAVAMAAWLSMAIAFG
jgi:hypothetical protein